jgi:hypothetical protein
MTFVEQLISRYREEILQLESDFAIVHSFVSNLSSRDDIDFEDIIQRADSLMERFPPNRLKYHCDVSTRMAIAKQEYVLPLF